MCSFTYCRLPHAVALQKHCSTNVEKKIQFGNVYVMWSLVCGSQATEQLIRLQCAYTVPLRKKWPIDCKDKRREKNNVYTAKEEKVTFGMILF